jgi:hypothetical protein
MATAKWFTRPPTRAWVVWKRGVAAWRKSFGALLPGFRPTYDIPSWTVVMVKGDLLLLHLSAPIATPISCDRFYHAQSMLPQTNERLPTFQSPDRFRFQLLNAHNRHSSRMDLAKTSRICTWVSGIRFDLMPLTKLLPPTQTPTCSRSICFYARRTPWDEELANNVPSRLLHVFWTPLVEFLVYPIGFFVFTAFVGLTEALSCRFNMLLLEPYRIFAPDSNFAPSMLARILKNLHRFWRGKARENLRGRPCISTYASKYRRDTGIWCTRIEISIDKDSSLRCTHK